MVYRTDCGCIASPPEPSTREYDSQAEYEDAWHNWDYFWAGKSFFHTRLCPKSLYYQPELVEPAKK